MATATRAPVTPRVTSPDTGDVVPVDVLWQLGLEKSARAIEIVGGPGSGKTTALAELETTAPPGLEVVFLDQPSPSQLQRAMNRSLVVFSAPAPTRLLDVVSYRLAPWTNDELVEYLLAMHPEQCRSVMTRLGCAADRHLPSGIPELWRPALGAMARDDSLGTVSAALRQELRQMLSGHAWSAAQKYAFAVITEQTTLSKNRHLWLCWLLSGAAVLGLLRHDAVRLILAADWLAGRLEARGGRRLLGRPFPRDLVDATAKLASSHAIGNLSKWLEGEAGYGAMAASLLHAAGTGWMPKEHPLPVLSCAYLRGAQWRDVNLAVGRIEGCDLSSSDLSGAVLDGARAIRARFCDAVLSGASLVRVRAEKADFESANLTSVKASHADLRDAILADADLSGADLARCNLQGANLSGARCVRANFFWADLTGAKIDGANLVLANLRWAILNHLPLRKTRLEGAILEFAQLSGCDLEGVDLPKANFRGAVLRDAVLTGARMRQVCFAGATLRETRLAAIDWEEADLRKADLRQCTFHFGSARCGLVDSPIACEGSRTGFYEDAFDEQNYRPPEEIRKANLCGVDLREAQLEGTDFYLVDLRRAKYTKDQFEYLQRCGAILFDRRA